MASSKLPRILHQAWASFFAYYWLPCPLCDEFMGGHESKALDGYSIHPFPDEPWHGRTICNDCYDKGLAT